MEDFIYIYIKIVMHAHSGILEKEIGRTQADPGRVD